MMNEEKEMIHLESKLIPHSAFRIAFVEHDGADGLHERVQVFVC
jgi:hypothetical protein